MMNFLGASNFTWVMRAILLAVVALSLMWLKSRIDRSYEADALSEKVSTYKYMLSEEQKRHAKAEIDAQAEYTKLQKSISDITSANEVAVKRAVKIAPSSRDCDYGDELTGVLNVARGYPNN